MSEASTRVGARPPITDGMRADARSNPNSWLYLLDPAYPAFDGEPPAHAYLGAYPVDGRGEILDQFRPNDRHRPYTPVPPQLGAPYDARAAESDLERTDVFTVPPQLRAQAESSPLGVGLDATVAADTVSAAELEHTLQRIHDGELAVTDLVPIVLAAPLLLYGRTPNDTTVFGFRERSSDTVMVCVATSPERVPADWPFWRVVRGRDLVDHLHGHPLLINPAGPVGAIVQASSLQTS